MRIAIVTESFFPQINGVTNTVRHTADRLLATGHDVLIVAPGPGLETYRTARVVRVRSVGLPGYRSFSVGLPDRALERAIVDFAPDLIHLASPFALGALGLRVARKHGIATLAVYQTDMAGFASQYGLHADALVSSWVGRLHRRVDRTLVPSSASRRQLAGLGVTNLYDWGRGVSLDLFDPQHRDEGMRQAWLRRDGDIVVGYVGRLAPEKELHRLQPLTRLPGVQLVIVGDGPARTHLERSLPGAQFTGMLSGLELAAAFASLDVFVHPGTAETFCQTVQEAQASGVAVVAPNCGGPVDLIVPGQTGLLFDPASSRDLAAQVASLVGSPGLRERLAQGGVNAVSGRTWDTLVDELINTHYRAVLERRPGIQAA